MTSSPGRDPFVATWQSARRPDAHKLTLDVQRADRMQSGLYRTVFALCVLIAALLAFEEATQRVATHGALTIVWMLAVAGGALWHRRARDGFVNALALETQQMLAYMIGRTKRGLMVARSLYAGTPLGALAGFAMMRGAGVIFGWQPPSGPAPSSLAVIQISAGVTVLLIMMTCGVVLARMLHRQIQDLEGKLKDAEVEV